MTRSINREMTFPQPVEAVWQALTDSAKMAEWMILFDEPGEFAAKVGQKFNLQVKPNLMTIQCEVLECVPLERLTYSWVGGGIDTRVSFRLEPDGAGTRLFFEHSGFEVEQAYQGAQGGWTAMFEKLTGLLAI